MSEREWFSLAVCAVLMLSHYGAVRVGRWVERFGSRTASFAGGAASAYVFLHLFAELDTSHTVIGERIHFAILVGFVVILAVDVLLGSHRGEQDASRFELRIGLAAIYNLLLAYTMSEQLPMGALPAISYALALGLHLLTQDLGFVETFGRAPYERVGRHVLAAAVGAGWLLSVFTQAPAYLLDLVTAGVAGFITYRVFAEELPDRSGLRVRWFLVGVTAYTFLEVISGL